MRTARNFAALAAASLMLSACVSLGADVDAPDSLLTLTPTATAPAGSGAVTGGRGQRGRYRCADAGSSR